MNSQQIKEIYYLKFTRCLSTMKNTAMIPNVIFPESKLPSKSNAENTVEWKAKSITMN